MIVSPPGCWPSAVGQQEFDELDELVDELLVDELLELDDELDELELELRWLDWDSDDSLDSLDSLNPLESDDSLDSDERLELEQKQLHSRGRPMLTSRRATGH